MAHLSGTSPRTWADHRRKRLAVVDGRLTKVARLVHFYTYLFALTHIVLTVAWR